MHEGTTHSQIWEKPSPGLFSLVKDAKNQSQRLAKSKQSWKDKQKLNRFIPNLRAADTIMSRLNLVHGNLSKVSLHMRLKQLQQGQTSAI